MVLTTWPPGHLATWPPDQLITCPLLVLQASSQSIPCLHRALASQPYLLLLYWYFLELTFLTVRMFQLLVSQTSSNSTSFQMSTRHLRSSSNRSCAQAVNSWLGMLGHVQTCSPGPDMFGSQSRVQNVWRSCDNMGGEYSTSS